MPCNLRNVPNSESLNLPSNITERELNMQYYFRNLLGTMMMFELIQYMKHNI